MSVTLVIAPTVSGFAGGCMGQDMQPISFTSHSVQDIMPAKKIWMTHLVLKYVVSMSIIWNVLWLRIYTLTFRSVERGGWLTMAKAAVISILSARSALVAGVTEKCGGITCVVYLLTWILNGFMKTFVGASWRFVVSKKFALCRGIHHTSCILLEIIGYLQ